MSGPYETLKRYYDDHTLGAKEWQRQGGRVIGYTCPYTPEEIICAAGLMPVRIVGDPNEEPTIVGQYYEDITSPWVRSAYDLLLKHKYDYLDGWVMAESNDSIIRLHYTFLGFPETMPKNYFWIDILRRANLRNYRFVLQELLAFQKALEETYRTKVTDAGLKKAISIYNENRRLLKQISELRRAKPSRISGEQASVIIGAGFWMPREEHNKLLKQFIAEIDKFPRPPSGERIFLSGSPQHNLDFIRMVESSGITIVGDDLDTGDRYAEGQVSEDPLMLPMESIAERTLWDFPDPRFYPTVMWPDYVESRVKEADVDGVLINILKWEDIYGFHYPVIKERLDAMKVPSLFFEMQEYRTAAPERLKIRVEAFSEMLRAARQQKRA